jgi:DNA-binding MarR family transcriptional regulator
LRFKASTVFPQLKSGDGRVTLDVDEEMAVLSMDGDPVLSIPVIFEHVLTAGQADEIARAWPQAAVLVAFERSSPQARATLREAGIPYATASGELFLHAPPIHVEWPAAKGSGWPTGATSSPFAIRASRVARWLLLHGDAEPSFKQLGEEIELSESVVSRTIRALEEDGLVTVASDSEDARRRRVGLRDAGGMLDALERADAARRPRRQAWEIGARNIDQTLARLRAGEDYLEIPYALGGLLAASLMVRVVEPVAVDVWIPRGTIDRWREELGALPARPGPGRLTIWVAPDPFVLQLRERVKEGWVADPVQTYLDCRRAGERALEAAEAIRQEMRW